MFLAVLHGRFHECDEYRLGVFRRTLEFRMELYSYEERMGRDLDNLHKACLRIASGSLHPGLLDYGQVIVVELVSVSVSFGNQFLAVYPVCERTFLYLAVVCSKTHRAPFDSSALLVFHQVYYRGGCSRIHLCGNGILESEDIAGELHDAHLHPQTYAEERHIVLPCIPDGNDLAFETSLSESRSHEYCIHIA